MINWVHTHWDDINISLSIWTFVISIAVLAFSTFRYLQIRTHEKRKDRFETYHRLLDSVCRGIDEFGPIKLLSQRAYIFELRNYPEYGPLTLRLLEKMEEDWRRGDQAKYEQLALEIAETRKCLTSR